MLQLVYTSIADESLDRDGLTKLCEQSSRNNRGLEITGVLVRHGSCFFQSLEGPRVPVEDTFLKIIVDPRHHSVKLISRRIITLREFGNWDMALFEDEDAHNHSSTLLASAPDFIREAFDDLKLADLRDGGFGMSPTSQGAAPQSSTKHGPPSSETRRSN